MFNLKLLWNCQKQNTWKFLFCSLYFYLVLASTTRSLRPDQTREISWTGPWPGPELDNISSIWRKLCRLIKSVSSYEVINERFTWQAKLTDKTQQKRMFILVWSKLKWSCNVISMSNMKVDGAVALKMISLKKYQIW